LLFQRQAAEKRATYQLAYSNVSHDPVTNPILVVEIIDNNLSIKMYETVF